MQTIAILGASENPTRYSNLACKILHDLAHTVYAMSLHGHPIHGTLSFLRLSNVSMIQ